MTPPATDGRSDLHIDGVTHSIGDHATHTVCRFHTGLQEFDLFERGLYEKSVTL